MINKALIKKLGYNKSYEGNFIIMIGGVSSYALSIIVISFLRFYNK